MEPSVFVLRGDSRSLAVIFDDILLSFVFLRLGFGNACNLALGVYSSESVSSTFMVIRYLTRLCMRLICQENFCLLSALPENHITLMFEHPPILAFVQFFVSVEKNEPRLIIHNGLAQAEEMRAGPKWISHNAVKTVETLPVYQGLLYY